MKMKMKNENEKLNLKDFEANLNPFDDLWLCYTNEKGEQVWKASGLNRLFEDSLGLLCLVPNHISFGILDFATVYKWPNLKQTGYKTNIKPVPIKILKDRPRVYKFRTEQGMLLNDIKIRFGDKTKSLCSYLEDRRINSLEHICNSAYAYGIKRGEIVLDVNKLDSKKISQILSSKQLWDNKKMVVVDGHPNIFESDELLDQLVITLLINNARLKHIESYKVLSVLLYQKISDFLRFHFKNLDKIEFKDLVDEAVAFVSSVIRNETILPARFRFPQTNKSSLSFWLLGNGRWADKRGGFTPKLQEYLKDNYVKSIINEEKKGQKYSFDENIELSDNNENITSLSKEINKKGVDFWSEKFNKKILLLDAEEAMKKWPERNQQIFKKHLEGVTLEEIGKQYGIQKAAVSKVINKGKEELRKLL